MATSLDSKRQKKVTSRARATSKAFLNLQKQFLMGSPAFRYATCAERLDT